VASRTKLIESRGGQFYGNPQSGRRSYDLEMAALTDAEAQSLLLNYLVVEDHTPFPVCLSPAGSEATSLLHTMTSLYCRFNRYETQANFVNLNKTPLRLVEDL
jgi:hypothetical protein